MPLNLSLMKQLAQYGAQVIGLAKDTKDNKDDIKKLKEQMVTMTTLLERVLVEFQHLKETETQERRMLRLELENALLRADRPARGDVRELPPPPPPSPNA